MKKGFTLIELLAVIVILAIIALIATPIILNIINDSKNNSAEVSMKNYLSAAEQAITKENLNSEFSPKECNILLEGDNSYLECDAGTSNAKTIQVEVEGDVPTSGIIKFEEGKVVEVINASIDNYYLNQTEETGLITTEIQKEILITSLKISYPSGDNDVLTSIPTITITPSYATNKELVFTMGSNYYNYCSDSVIGTISDKATINSKTGELVRTFNQTDAVVLVTATTTDGSNITATYEAPLGDQYFCGAW